jgi:hypothetical protein
MDPTGHYGKIFVKYHREKKERKKIRGGLYAQ